MLALKLETTDMYVLNAKLRFILRILPNEFTRELLFELSKDKLIKKEDDSLLNMLTESNIEKASLGSDEFNTKCASETGARVQSIKISLEVDMANEEIVNLRERLQCHERKPVIEMLLPF